MKYKFTIMTEEDLEKIFHDMKDDPAKQYRMKFFSVDIESTWLVDHENNSYLFRGPSSFKQSWASQDFTFFFEGAVYFLERLPYSRPPTPTNIGIVIFDEQYSGKKIKELSNEKLAKLKQAIECAFSVYGRFGEPNEKHPFRTIFEE